MHTNNGACLGCKALFEKFPKFHPILLDWFIKFQKENPDGHISCAGRDKIDQDADYEANRSRARWGESAHNYNMAIDIFRQTDDGKASYDPWWYLRTVALAITPELYWYGNLSKFIEMPHVEINNWKKLTSSYPLIK